MFKFKDSKGREWDLKIHLGIAERLRKTNVIDLFKILEKRGARYTELMSNPADLAGVVWAIVEPEAAAKSVTFDDFMMSLDGDAIDGMIDGFSRALADFSPTLRNLILKGLQKNKEAKESADNKITSAMDKIDVNQLVQKGLDQMESQLKKRMESLGDDLSSSVAPS